MPLDPRRFPKAFNGGSGNFLHSTFSDTLFGGENWTVVISGTGMNSLSSNGDYLAVYADDQHWFAVDSTVQKVYSDGCELTSSADGILVRMGLLEAKVSWSGKDPRPIVAKAEVVAPIPRQPKTVQPRPETTVRETIGRLRRPVRHRSPGTY